jgi:hypothetical protein
MKGATMRVFAFALLSATLTLVAGCGGSDDGPLPPAVGNTVPASALASPAAFTSYVGGLPADDSVEPLDLDGVMPPVSDTDEPDEV